MLLDGNLVGVKKNEILNNGSVLVVLDNRENEDVFFLFKQFLKPFFE